MDQLTAHLDRGWDLAQRGDGRGAEISARRALEVEADSPEAHNLLGFSRALLGEHDEALDLYLQAIALDDKFLEPVLNAAELCLSSLGDLEAALAFCNDALELIDGEEELTDTLLLQFDALMGLGRAEDAHAVCSRLPSPPFANPIHSFLVGRALFEMGDSAGAEALLLVAAKQDVENPEPHYYLAMIREEQGDAGASIRGFLKSRDLDLQLPSPAWSLSYERFGKVVEEVVEQLAPRLRSLVDSSQVFLANVPGVEVVVDGADPRAPILVDAIEGSSTPMRVFVYQRNIERIAGCRDRIEEALRISLEQEIASFAFGELEPPSAERFTLN